MSNPTILQAGIKDVTFGENVKVVAPVNLYGCTIGANCFIGPFCEIQNDVIIGGNTKVQSHAFVCSMVVIGEHCFQTLAKPIYDKCLSGEASTNIVAYDPGPNQKLYSISYDPVRDAAGDVVAAMLIARDVTALGVTPTRFWPRRPD